MSIDRGRAVGAVANYLFGLRIVALAAAVSSTFAIVYFEHFEFRYSNLDLVLASASVLLAFGVATFHLRHVGLSVVVALCPLPGLVVGAAIADRVGLTSQGYLFPYAFGTAIAIFVAGEIVRHIVRGTEPTRGGSEVLLASVTAVASALSLIISTTLLWTIFISSAQLASCMGLVTAAVSALLLAPLSASLLQFDETYLTSANRSQEARGRLFERVAMVCDTRWGLSVTGIAFVFAALGWFGSGTSISQPQVWVTSSVLMFVLSLAGGTTWRDGLATVAAIAVVVMLDMWAYGGMVESSVYMSFVGLHAMTFFLILAAQKRAREHQRHGEQESVARLMSMEEMGERIFFSILINLMVTVPWIWPIRSPVGLVVSNVFGAVAALLLAPAFATTIALLLPRWRSADEVFGRR